MSNHAKNTFPLVATSLTFCLLVTGCDTTGLPPVQKDKFKYDDTHYQPVVDSGVRFFINDDPSVIMPYSEYPEAIPVQQYPGLTNFDLQGQDANFNRAGIAGGTPQEFVHKRYTKLDAEYADIELNDDDTYYGCVRDNFTGLVWEHKKVFPGNIHHYTTKYSWYDPNPETNGGFAGQQDGGQCENAKYDTQWLIDQVNAEKLCGFDDWRLPHIWEIRSLIDYSKPNLEMVDANFFPNLGFYSHYWTAQTSVGSDPRANELAYGFHVYEGRAQKHHKSCANYGDAGETTFENTAILVRSGPVLVTPFD
ncbi:MAG: DUF1566 domain-containing protein [Gammaproteobacteria bacterium]|nr:DUF1566 domain-containing protein [Gammaproteobacteria bacterium]MDH5730035.1 DUF1566 domain-containing protein [Gammaproteobacteria bacterium]